MAKSKSRDKQRREKLRRLKAKQPMPGINREHIGDLNALCEKATARHASLLRVVKLKAGSVARTLRGPDLLSHIGYTDFRHIQWESDSADQYYTKHIDGGLVETFRDSSGALRTLAFIMTNAVRTQVRAAIDIAVLHHELGHVDDIEKGVNLREGEPVDLEKAELYAHRYACNKLMEENLRYPLAWFLTEMIPQLQESDASLVRAAAHAFMESPEYAKARKWNAFYLQFFE